MTLHPVFYIDLKNFIKGFSISYKSNTELLLVYNKSFIRIQKAMNRYNAKPKPRVTNVKYIKDVLTTFALMPIRSAIRWHT